MLEKFISFLKKKNTLQKFISFLKKENIKFVQEKNKIIITCNNIFITPIAFLTSLPEGIIFNNVGSVYLDSLKSLPENITFNNGRDILLNSLTSLPCDTIFNNGGDIYLDSLESLPEDITFNNGGYIFLKSKTLTITKDYIARFKIKIEDNSIILYKRVSYDFKTQENTKNETVWEIGSKVIHPNWQPELDECGEGKFHACAYPHWCDIFRNKKGDKYIAIKVSINDLHEWKDNPSFPQKIGFREGIVLYECDRDGNKI